MGGGSQASPRVLDHGIINHGACIVPAVLRRN
jgi:hypothetical protein